MSDKFIGYLPDTVDGIDEFGVHTKIAEAVSEKIINADVTKHPLTLGLFGEWGSGKSFIVEKIHQDIKQHDDIAFVNIDVWKYNGIPLLRHVLYEIAEQGPTNNFEIKDKEKLLKDTKKAVLIGTKFEEYKSKAYLRIEKAVSVWKWVLLGIALLSFVFSFIPEIPQLLKSIFDTWTIPVTIYAFIFKRVNDEVMSGFANVVSRMKDKIVVMDETIVPTISPEQFEQEFDNIINKLKQHNITKYVIVFDNIDRCKGDFAYDVLSTIKTYMNKENCVYLIPCDDIAIKHYLDKEYHHTDQTREHHRDFALEFLDKLFNTYFRVPYINELSRDKFIDKCLSEIPYFKDMSQKSKIVEVLYYAYKGETPRQIKKYINDLSFYYEIALKVDPQKRFLLDDMKIFAIMIAIKQISPDFEKSLISNPSLIRELKAMQLSGDESKYQQFSNIKELLIKLQFDFPSSKSALSYIFMSEDDNEQELIENLRDGNTIELSDFNMITAVKSMQSDENKETFLQNQFNGLLLSIVYHGTENFLSRKANENNAEALYNNLKLCVENSENYNICFGFLKNNSTLSVDELSEFFQIIKNFTIRKKDHIILFRKIIYLNNFPELYSAWLKIADVALNDAIYEYLKELSAQEKTEENSQIHKVLTPQLLSLLTCILDMKRYSLIPQELLDKISPLISYEASEWIDLEKRLITEGGFPIAFRKIFEITNECDRIIQGHRVTVSSNVEFLFEKLDYAISFLPLSTDILTQGIDKDQLTKVMSNFTNSLIKLSSLQDRSIQLFLLAIKLFGDTYITTNFMSGNIFYDNRTETLSEIYKDNELLEIFKKSPKITTEVLENNEERKKLLEFVNVDWKFTNIDLFILNPFKLHYAKDFYESGFTSWNDAQKHTVLKRIVESFILTLNKFPIPGTITEQTIMPQFEFILEITEKTSPEVNVFSSTISESLFKNITKDHLVVSVEFLRRFVQAESKYITKYLELFLFTIANMENLHNITIPDHKFICETIAKIPLNSDIKFLCKKFTSLTNKDTVIEVGLEILSRSNNDVIKQCAEELELIKKENKFVDKIDSLLSNK